MVMKTEVKSRSTSISF